MTNLKITTIFIDNEEFAVSQLKDDFFLTHKNAKIISINDPLIKEIPKSISGLEQLMELDLSGCANLSTLPELPKSLRELNLSGCDKLKFMPDLVEKLCDLDDTGCNVVCPSHFNPATLTEELEAKFSKVIRDNCKKTNQVLSSSGAIEVLFNKFLKGKIDLIEQEDSIIKTAKEIVRSTKPFLEFIEKNPQHLAWINEASLPYLGGCLNQPLFGFFEINALIQIAEEKTFSDKLISSNSLFAFNGIKGIVRDERKPESKESSFFEREGGEKYEAEAGVNLLMMVHKKALEEGIINRPWMAVPEKGAWLEIVKDWCERKDTQGKITDLIQKIAGRDHEDCIHFLCDTHYCDIWKEIAFPNSKEIKAIEARYDKLFEEGKHISLVERSKEIMDKVIELTRNNLQMEKGILPNTPQASQDSVFRARGISRGDARKESINDGEVLGTSASPAASSASSASAGCFSGFLTRR